MPPIRSSLLLVAVLGGCQPAQPIAQPAPGPPDVALRFDVTAIDRRVDPCHDFYDFACGGWRASHPIPADRSRWSRYGEIQTVNLERERAIVEAAAHAGPTSPVARRVGAYYAACLDQQAIDTRGIAPIQDLLTAIDRIHAPADLVEILADLHRSVGPLLFSLEIDSDAHDARKTIATIEPGELGLDDAEPYTRDDAAALRGQYRGHVEHVLRLLGDRDPAGNAARVVALETALAHALPDAAGRRDSDARVHPMTLDELPRHAAIDWRRYVIRLGAPRLAQVNVGAVGWLDAIGAQLTPDGLTAIRAYLRFHVARRRASVLPTSIDDAFFAFDGRIVRGTKVRSPRWKRCLAMIDSDLGDDVGRLFVERWFPPASQARAAALVSKIVGALRAELAANTWLGAPARAAAIKKLANMRFTIGYSEHWERYDRLEIRADDPVGNRARAARLTLDRELAKLDHPTDRDEFFALPQQQDAFGNKSRVSVGFTAGFLQPPVFDPEIDDPITFGGLGGVVGHEITHHFDDEGRKFDIDGNLAPWWSPADVAGYQARAQCFIDEYNQFRIDDGSPVDGQLTLGENIADNSGLRIAWEALAPGAGPALDGFTPAQRFFLGWAQIRCENVAPEAARSQVQSDEHAPGRWRVNGVVRNMPEFGAAFACPAGAPMAPETRCRVW